MRTMAGKSPHWVHISAKQTVCAALFCLLLVLGPLYLFGGDLARDLWYASTYERSDRHVAKNGSCTRHRGIITTCDVEIHNRSTHERVDMNFVVGLADMGGWPLRVVASTRNPDAVSLEIAAQDYLWNRVVTLGLWLALFGGVVGLAAARLATGRYTGGAAYHALIAEVRALSSGNQAAAR